MYDLNNIFQSWFIINCLLYFSDEQIRNLAVYQ
jgi:hypothetical protein